MHIWVMSKAFHDLHHGDMPVAYSHARKHVGMGVQANGWGLAWLAVDAQHLAFIRAGIDPNVQYVGLVGRESSPPTPLLLETYADKLGSDTYTTLEQVLLKLGEWDIRFLLDFTENK